MDNRPEQIVLAIETATEPGSVAVLSENSFEIDYKIGRIGVSQSIDLLPAISELLEKNRISIGKIKLIAVSHGPGSFTGIRVGAATALALAFGRKSICAGVSTLAALAASAETTGKIRSVISGGRGTVFYRDFICDRRLPPQALGKILATGLDEIIYVDGGNSLETIVLDSKLKLIHARFAESAKVMIQSDNLAKYVGLIAIENLKNGESEALEPFYGREFEVGVG